MNEAMSQAMNAAWPSTALLVVTMIGALTAGGVYLMLRARIFDVVIGLTLLSYAVNIFIFAMGRPKVNAAPIIGSTAAPTLAGVADPLPQALVLTAIVISFAMTALLLVIAVRSHADNGSDHVDGSAPADGAATPAESAADTHGRDAASTAR